MIFKTDNESLKTNLEQKLVEAQKNHDKLEEQMRIELENEKSKNEALVLEMADLKEKMQENEEITRSQNEVSIKSELNSFESMLECEGKCPDFDIIMSILGLKISASITSKLQRSDLAFQLENDQPKRHRKHRQQSKQRLKMKRESV